MISLTFLFGAFCSSVAGIIGMWSSTRSNARVAHTSCVASFRSTIVVALRSGSIVGITVVSMCVFSISFIFALCHLFVEPDVTRVADLLIGYGFGASFVAMFAQLGGGIYTKAADVGADLVGKVEMDIPEDDPRNPAVIADNVGDNVGDVAGMGADLFESFVGSIIACATLANGDISKIAFPFWLAGAGVLASIVGDFLVSIGDEGPGQFELTIEEAMTKEDHRNKYLKADGETLKAKYKTLDGEGGVKVIAEDGEKVVDDVKQQKQL